jgi:hypothetical protein
LPAEGRCSSSSSFMRRGRGKPWANVNVLFNRPCQFLAGAEFPLAGDAASPRAIGRAAMDLWRVAVGCCHCRSTCSATSMRALQASPIRQMHCASQFHVPTGLDFRTGQPSSQGWRTFLRTTRRKIGRHGLLRRTDDRFRRPLCSRHRSDRRRDLVWINVTKNPTAEWVVRQITEAFSWDGAPG